MATATFDEHKIEVAEIDGESKITCTCGWSVCALPQFVLPIMERHYFINVEGTVFSEVANPGADA